MSLFEAAERQILASASHSHSVAVSFQEYSSIAARYGIQLITWIGPERAPAPGGLLTVQCQYDGSWRALGGVRSRCQKEDVAAFTLQLEQSSNVSYGSQLECGPPRDILAVVYSERQR